MTTPRMEPASGHATTTEELIVQYLDGELVRKELESVLFGRLAESEDARIMMREHLVLRGAIRAASEHESIQLSPDLDQRTRARIEQALEVMTPANGRRVADAPLVTTNVVRRRLARWTLRPSFAIAALLLAIGTTWFVTRTEDTRMATVTPAVPAPSTNAPAQESSQVQLAAAQPEHVAAAHQVVHPVRTTKNPAAAVQNPTQLAQSNSSAQPAAENKPEASEPVMFSKRYAKILQANEKHEVVVTSQDRL